MLSLIVPHYPINEKVDALLDRLLKSTEYDELVLVLNNKMGFAKSVNWGLRAAKGDFLAVVSNDVEFKGDIRLLCDPAGVCSPKLNGDIPPRGLWGCCFVLPRWVYEKIGGLDENFELAYYEDDDYALRLKEAGIPMICKDNVGVFSEGGQTMNALPKEERGEAYTRNQEYFKKKWPNAPLYG